VRLEARAAHAGTGAAFMVLIGGGAGYAIVRALRAGLTLRALLIALGAVLLLLFLLRAMSLNRRATRAPGTHPGDDPGAGEPTGVWGVGGPAMREPGTTGVYRGPGVDRRYENRDE
jgi:hypothetical protein